MRTSLVIMAAGIGSRFGGGIKQLEPVGVNDEIIMDYSVHDAIAAGFNKIVFIIRRDIEADFRERIGDRIEKICAGLGVETAYAFQDREAVPEGCTVPEGRTKPWGTGQAVLAAADILREPFMVINADDYYGKGAYKAMYAWLQERHAENAYSMAGFILKNTLSENGGVTRGICTIRPGSTHISDVVETKQIVCTPEGAETQGRALDPECLVSMNMWGFPAREGEVPPFLKVLQENFRTFFEKDVPADPLKAEYLLPTLIGGMLRSGKCTVKALPTTDKWFGVTYKEDKQAVIESFRELIDRGVYPRDLYSDLM